MGSCALLLAACGGGHSRSSGPTTTVAPAGTADPVGSRLTITQALQLSQVLYRNYVEGGANVVVDVPYSATVHVVITGSVDFDHHEGHLVVRTTSEGAQQVEDVDYTADRVYERGGPVVDAEIAASGRTGVEWVSRRPDEQTRPIDKIIAILVALASPQRDNPLLLQESHASWQGTAHLDGAAVDRYRYDQAISYVVGARDGLLREFLGTIQGFASTITVSLSDWGPHHEPPPAASTVIAQPDPSKG